MDDKEFIEELINILNLIYSVNEDQEVQDLVEDAYLHIHEHIKEHTLQ